MPRTAELREQDEWVLECPVSSVLANWRASEITGSGEMNERWWVPEREARRKESVGAEIGCQEEDFGLITYLRESVIK